MIRGKVFFRHLETYINNNLILHIFIYFLLVFFIPFLSKIVYFYSGNEGLFFDFRMTTSILYSSFAVLISDIIQLMLWKYINKYLDLPLRKVLIIYIYNKLFLPVSGILILVNTNISFSLLNIIYMSVFTLLFFNLFIYRKTIIKVLTNVLLILLLIISFIYVYQIFY
jgi:hypothetical protein